MSTQSHNNLTGKRSDSYDRSSAQSPAHHRGGPSRSFISRSINTRNPPEIGDRASLLLYPEDRLVEGDTVARGINYNLVLDSGLVDRSQKEDTNQLFAGDAGDGQSVDKDNWSENTKIHREDIRVNDSQHQPNKWGPEKKGMPALGLGLGFETRQVEATPQTVQTLTPPKDGASTERLPIHTANSTPIGPNPALPTLTKYPPIREFGTSFNVTNIPSATLSKLAAAGFTEGRSLAAEQTHGRGTKTDVDGRGRAQEDRLEVDQEVAPEGGSALNRDYNQTEEALDSDISEPQKLLRRLGKQLIPNHIFSGAHDFMVNNPVFVNYSKSAKDSSKSAIKAMNLLSRKAMLNALLDSDARSPLPTCLQGTREEIRNRVLAWVADRNRESNLLWVCGPAGSGTSAVAQTIAEYCKAQGWLGAAFFFSRAHRAEDRTRIIPSIAYQLAAASPAYRNHIVSLLEHDSSVLEGTLPSQFQTLIAEPLLKIKGPAAGPILVLLDGLSHCRDDDFQQDLLEYIGRFAARSRRLGHPVIWIIVSRREWQIGSTFETADPPIHFQKEELRIDTSDSRKDVSRFVHHSFQIIRRKSPHVAPRGSEWPSKDDLFKINSASSGLFSFASAILDFVKSDNPAAKLRDCVGYLENKVIPKDGNPLQPLYALYQNVLDGVPPDTLPLAKRILSFIALGAREISAQVVTELLSLDSSDFYGSLYRLHSVLDIPTLENGHAYPVSVFHQSWEDFLKSRVASGDFDLDIGVIPNPSVARIERRCLDVLIEWRSSGSSEILPSYTYYTDPNSNVLKFIMQELWAVWSNKNEREILALHETLQQFSFAEYDHARGRLEALAPLKGVERHLTKLLRILSGWQEINKYGDHPILRSKPICQVDHQLFEEYHNLISHTGITELDCSRMESESWSYKVFSLGSHRKGPLLPPLVEKFANPGLMYFLLGYQLDTCLFIAYQECVP